MSPAETPAANPPAETPPRRSLGPRLALLAVAAAAVAAFYALGLERYVSLDSVRAHADRLKEATDEHLLVALLLFFAVYAAVTALSVPVAVYLTLAAGALFGRWLGTAVVSAASTLGATLAFLGSRYVFRDYLQRRFGARLAAVNRGIETDGAYYLFTLRLVPAVPFWLINLGMGLTRLPVRTFVWVSWLGMLPATFLYVNAGLELSRVTSPRDVLSPPLWVALALLGVVPLALRKLLAWRKRREPNPPP